MQRINRALGDAAEMTRVLDEPRLVADDENAPELKVREGAIDFEHLSFAYRDAAAGESVFQRPDAFMWRRPARGSGGKSGSGKTTLTKLLLRLDDVQGGRVLVDGQDGLALHAAEPASPGCLRAAGGAAVPPFHSREYRLRTSRRYRRTDSLRRLAWLMRPSLFDRLPML